MGATCRERGKARWRAESNGARAAALSIDPQAANGVEAVYGLTISPEYKTL